MIEIIFLISGLVISCIGAYMGSSIPLIDMLKTAAGFGGGEEEYWINMDKKLRRKFIISNFLLFVGTFIQIIAVLIPKYF